MRASRARDWAHGCSRPVLQQADAAHALCYLETPFRQTHVFYQRLGFQITSESHPFRGAPPLWTMLRQPGRGSG
jgi:hypothetical protein